MERILSSRTFAPLAEEFGRARLKEAVVEHLDSLRLAAVLGQGLISLPGFIVSDELKAGRLVPVLTEFPAPEMPINAIYPHRQFLPSKGRSFIDLAIKHFHDANWIGMRL